MVALEQVAERAVGPEVPRQQLAGAVDGLEHHGTGPVAHQHGHRPVVPVGDPAEGLRPDDQEAFGADGQHAVGHGQGVDEARAGGVDVEGAPGDADAVLHGGRGARDDLVRGGGGQDHAVDLVRPPAGPGQGGQSGLDGQLGGGAADPALADAGPLPDPGVVGVHGHRQVVVGHHLVGHGDAPAGHDAAAVVFMRWWSAHGQPASSTWIPMKRCVLCR